LKKQREGKDRHLVGLEPDEILDGLHFEKEPKKRKPENDHYYTEKPKSKLVKKLVIYNYDDLHKYKFYNASGVFAFKSKVDRATRILIAPFLNLA